MSRDEIDTLLRAVKGTFPKIEFTTEMVREWTKRLANYDFKDVEENFNNYVLSGNTQVITLVDLIKGLHTKQQKEPIKGYFYCARCNRRHNTIEEMDKCYERDLRIKYIRKMSEKFNIEYNDYFKDLYKSSLEDINKNYDNFILRVIEEQKKNPILKEYELDGLRDYYKNVIIKNRR